MAEEEDPEEEERAPPAGTAPSLLRYLPLVLVVLLLQAGAAYYLIDRFLFRPDDAELLTAVDEGERPRVIPESNVPEASVDLGEFVINPRSEGIRMLVTVDVTLAVAPDDAVGEIRSDNKIDQVLDAVHYELAYATPSELGNRDGRSTVKERIKRRVNEVLYEGQVVDVFFGRFIMQALTGYRDG